jgi:hypothetical protein
VQQARTTFENNIAAVTLILELFQQKGGSKVNSATLAFAAAYLDHYLNAGPVISAKVTNVMLPRMLLEITKKYTRGGDDNKIHLKPYDTNGAFIRDYVRRNIDDARVPGAWPLGDDLNLTRAHLPRLAAMSLITSAQVGRYYKTYTDVVRAQEHESLFEKVGQSLGYFCAGAPSFNKRFLSAVNLAIGPDTVMPKIPRNAVPPHIPQVTVEDPVLVNTWNTVEATIREHCFAGHRPADGDIALAARQTECFRYYNAIFILLLDWISRPTSAASTPTCKTLYSEDVWISPRRTATTTRHICVPVTRCWPSTWLRSTPGRVIELHHSVAGIVFASHLCFTMCGA